MTTCAKVTLRAKVTPCKNNDVDASCESDTYLFEKVFKTYLKGIISNKPFTIFETLDEYDVFGNEIELLIELSLTVSSAGILFMKS